MKDSHSEQDKHTKKTIDGTHLTGTLNKTENNVLDKKLKESEMRYRRLFETAQDGILILDFETGNIVDANPFLVNILGFPLSDIMGKKLWEIGLFSNKEESEIAFIELQTKGYIRFEDMPIQRRNGKIAEVEFICNVYLVNDTKVIQCNIRDITDRKRAENALLVSEQNLKEQNSNFRDLNKEYADLNEELTESIDLIQHINNDLIIAKLKAEESDHLKSAFLANMSHEIRTPMNAIMGFSELILGLELANENLNNYAQIINASTQQLLTIISDIIDISKIEAGQFTVDIESVDVTTLLDELFDIYKKVVDCKNLKLHLSTDHPENLLPIQTDRNRVKQIFCNLLNNAIKFTREGEIEFGYKMRANFVEFYVSDTGIGISKDNQPLIFERFTQVNPIDRKINSGNGLGLSISKALVEKLGGSIAVQSEPGKGSSFIFTIPYKK